MTSQIPVAAYQLCVPSRLRAKLILVKITVRPAKLNGPDAIIVQLGLALPEAQGSRL